MRDSHDRSTRASTIIVCGELMACDCLWVHQSPSNALKYVTFRYTHSAPKPRNMIVQLVFSIKCDAP